LALTKENACYANRILKTIKLSPNQILIDWLLLVNHADGIEAEAGAEA